MKIQYLIFLFFVLSIQIRCQDTDEKNKEDDEPKKKVTH